MTPRRPARQEQIRDICARDQEDQPDDPHHHDKRLPIGLPQVRYPHRRRPRAHRLDQIRLLQLRQKVRGHCRLAQERLNILERRAGALSRLPGFQPRHDREPPRRALVQERARAKDWFRANRNDDIERPANFRAEKTSLRDSDHRERLLVEPQGLADNGRVAAEPALPERVADDGDESVRGATAIVVGREKTAELGTHTEAVKEAAAGHQPGGVVRLATLGEVESHG